MSGLAGDLDALFDFRALQQHCLATGKSYTPWESLKK